MPIPEELQWKAAEAVTKAENTEQQARDAPEGEEEARSKYKKKLTGEKQ